MTEYREGGWTYEALAEQTKGFFEGNWQTVGEMIPEFPADMRPEQR